MEKEEQMEKKLKFDCECNGCRNYPTRPAEIWHESQIPSKENGTYYFTKEAMRFFSSRIVDFKGVGIAPSVGESQGVGSLLVLVSSRHGYEGASRYYEIVMLCPYGKINRNSAQFETLPKARKSAIWNCQVPRETFVCSCHGCQLDEAGR